MDSSRVCGFLAASCLLLVLLGDPTAACSCSLMHPQNVFCFSDVVMRVKFLGVIEDGGDEMMLKRYEVKTTKVYKGPEMAENIRFLHTPGMDSLCGYEHRGPFKGEEYIIAGPLVDEDHVYITLCSFIKPWAELPPAQKEGMISGYIKGCDCTVKTCHSTPCSTSSDSECLWTDSLIGGSQADHLACLPQGKRSGSCSWRSLSSPHVFRRFLRRQ